MVSLANSGLSVGLIDSANIILKKQGSSLSYYRRLDKGTNNLTLVMDDTQTGNWTAEITIYTKKGTANASRMYTRSVAFTLPLRTDLQVTGPTSELRGAWKPHIVLASQNNDVVVVVAEDSEEPYFDIRVKDNKWDLFYVERHAFNRSGGMNEQVAADDWECASSCYTSDKYIVNNTAFSNFSNTVKTKAWNNSEIFVIVADGQSGQEETFFYTYNKE